MRAVVLFGLFAPLAVLADVYMHFPKGSNNRNREKNGNRNNANRLFDSQNNGNGGYQWTGHPHTRGSADPLTYFSDTEMDIIWTHQHACNSNSTHCTIVLQMMCDDMVPGVRDGYPTGGFQNQNNNDANDNEPNYIERSFTTNNGGNNAGTAQIPNNAAQSGCNSVSDGGADPFLLKMTDNALSMGKCDPCNKDDPTKSLSACEYGQHETYYMYQKFGVKTARNKGLFTADRNLNKQSALSTRQNPNGNRRGLEIPEERDYYPYWNPSLWMDIAVLTSDESWCPYYQSESQNVKARQFCNLPQGDQGIAPIEEQACTAAGGSWTTFKPFNQAWSGANIGAPDCKVMPKDYQNYLGYTMDGRRPNYRWRIPNFGDGKTRQCTLRLRYNISTADYASMAGFGGTGDAELDGRIVDSRFNCKNKVNQRQQGDNDVDTATGGSLAGNCNAEVTNDNRPLYNRPEVKVFKDSDSPLSIALNSDQSSRTFQDRSHVFNIAPRSEVNTVFQGSDCSMDAEIVYVQATGRRGNIVQTYPAIEYKFVHEEMEVPYGACLLWQWGNSWFNENQNPNNAEGWRYSGSHNAVEVKDLAHNFPRGHYGKNGDTEVYVSGFFNEQEAKFFALQEQAEILKKGVRATAGSDEIKTFECKKETEVDDDDNHPLLCGKLNLPRGKVEYATIANTPGEFKFLSTRNNNFSNRKETMSIKVGADPNASNSFAADTAGAVIGAIFGIGALAFIVVVILGFLGVIKVGFIENIKNKKKKAQTGNDSSAKYTTQVEKRTQV